MSLLRKKVILYLFRSMNTYLLLSAISASVWQISLAYYWSVQRTLASYWLEEFAFFTPSYFNFNTVPLKNQSPLIQFMMLSLQRSIQSLKGEHQNCWPQFYFSLQEVYTAQYLLPKMGTTGVLTEYLRPLQKIPIFCNR
jgi:hypothetical protein